MTFLFIDLINSVDIIILCIPGNNSPYYYLSTFLRFLLPDQVSCPQTFSTLWSPWPSPTGVSLVLQQNTSCSLRTPSMSHGDPIDHPLSKLVAVSQAPTQADITCSTTGHTCRKTSGLLYPFFTLFVPPEPGPQSPPWCCKRSLAMASYTSQLFSPMDPI